MSFWWMTGWGRGINCGNEEDEEDESQVMAAGIFFFVLFCFAINKYI